MEVDAEVEADVAGVTVVVAEGEAADLSKEINTKRTEI